MAHLLIIEDEPLVRETLCGILVSAGHTVVEAENGAVGLKQLEHSQVDLVLTDIVMPKKEGIETIQEIHRLHPQVKIVAMSGYSSHDYLNTAEKLGADAILRKPFRPAELHQTIERVLWGTSYRAGVKR